MTLEHFVELLTWEVLHKFDYVQSVIDNCMALGVESRDVTVYAPEEWRKRGFISFDVTLHIMQERVDINFVHITNKCHLTDELVRLAKLWYFDIVDEELTEDELSKLIYCQKVQFNSSLRIKKPLHIDRITFRTTFIESFENLIDKFMVLEAVTFGTVDLYIGNMKSESADYLSALGSVVESLGKMSNILNIYLENLRSLWDSEDKSYHDIIHICADVLKGVNIEKTFNISYYHAQEKQELSAMLDCFDSVSFDGKLREK